MGSDFVKREERWPSGWTRRFQVGNLATLHGNQIRWSIKPFNDFLCVKCQEEFINVHFYEISRDLYKNINLSLHMT